MSEQHLLLAGALFIGLILGIIGMLVFNKVRGGSVSPGALKKEMEDYQGQVETHFEQTSEKFQQMATQYQDLYQHLAVGATSLCRPENISPGLIDQSDPLAKNKLIEQEPSVEQESTAEQAASDDEQKSENTEQEPLSAENTGNEEHVAESESVSDGAAADIKEEK